MIQHKKTMGKECNANNLIISDYGLQCSNCLALDGEKVAKRLEYLRKKINKKNISYGDILELQGLAEYIPKNDTILLEWAGVPEFKECEKKDMNGNACYDCESGQSKCGTTENI